MDTWIIILIAALAAVTVIAAAYIAVIKKKRSGAKKKAGEIGENAVASVLKKCDSGNALVINDYMTVEEGQSRQIDHICICSNGVFVIETKNFAGTIYGGQDEYMWQQYVNGQKHEFYSPLKQNITHMYCVKKLLPSDVPVFQYVVFTNGDISHISAENVTDIFSLRQIIDGADGGKTLSKEEKEELYAALEAAAADISDEEHARQVKKAKELAENNMCPHCEVKLEKVKSRDGIYYECPECGFVKHEK